MVGDEHCTLVSDDDEFLAWFLDGSELPLMLLGIGNVGVEHVFDEFSAIAE